MQSIVTKQQEPPHTIKKSTTIKITTETTFGTLFCTQIFEWFRHSSSDREPHPFQRSVNKRFTTNAYRFFVHLQVKYGINSKPLVSYLVIRNLELIANSSFAGSGNMGLPKQCNSYKPTLTLLCSNSIPLLYHIGFLVF